MGVRGIMRTHIASIFTLLLAGAAGCGAVDDGACPTAMQSDDIACTLDVCNAEAGSWSHIADNSFCEAGQACSPTAGCVSAGAITGNATLYGKTDHSGIVVTVEGLEGATTTTDAMGNWTIVLPPGSYAVTYSKEKYIGEREANIVVLAEAAERAPHVELAHGEILDPERTVLSSYSYQLNPDRSYIVEGVTSAVGTSFYAAPTNGTKPPVLLVSNPTNVYLTNTHIVWRSSAGGTISVWSRPLSGASLAVPLGVVGAGFNMSVIGTPREFTLMLRSNSSTGINQVFVAKTDGSIVHPTAAWTQPDSNHFYAGAAYNATHALIGVTNYSAFPPTDSLANTPFVRVDLASNTATLVNVGFATNNVYLGSVSPDNNHVYGYIDNSGAATYWIRGFIGSVSGPAAPTLAPSYGAASTQYSDWQDFSYPAIWLPDSSGVVYKTFPYAGNTAQGDLRVWMTGSATSSVISPANPAAYNIGNQGSYRLVGKNLLYGDGPAGGRVFKIAAVSANPVSFTLDSSTFNTIGLWTSHDDSYVVWSQAESANGGVHTKIMSAALTTPLTTTPTITQLGANVPGGCTFEGYLAGTTFFRFCGDTRTIAAFAKSSNAATGMASSVVGSKWRFDKSNRLGFRQDDGKLYSLGTDLKLIATYIDPNVGPITSFSTNPGGGVNGWSNLNSDWILYRDGTTLMTRASRVDGTVLDEPILPCDVSAFYVSENPDNSQIVAPNARCQDLTYHLGHVPTANLP